MTALHGRALMATVVDDDWLHVCTLSGLPNPCRRGKIEDVYRARDVTDARPMRVVAGDDPCGERWEGWALCGSG